MDQSSSKPKCTIDHMNLMTEARQAATVLLNKIEFFVDVVFFVQFEEKEVA